MDTNRPTSSEQAADAFDDIKNAVVLATVNHDISLHEVIAILEIIKNRTIAYLYTKEE